MMRNKMQNFAKLGALLPVMLGLSGCYLVNDVQNFDPAQDCRYRMIRGTTGVGLSEFKIDRSNNLDRVDVYIAATATFKWPSAGFSFAPPEGTPPFTNPITFHCVYLNGAFSSSDRNPAPVQKP
ncbi:MAG: hypothetical protein ORN98_05990 [Alphaproteobacteria bacterium]|nr:hypothetical protein [Alphaproteobacteria bacterium]